MAHIFARHPAHRRRREFDREGAEAALEPRIGEGDDSQPLDGIDEESSGRRRS